MQSSKILQHEILHGMWSNEYVVEFTASSEMKSVEVIIYYVHQKTGEIISDTLAIDFVEHHNNFVRTLKTLS
jgi:hypothetical protein